VKKPSSTKSATIPEFLAGGGEMGERIREFDWSKTSLGPVERWPQSLRTCIRIMLTSRQPIWIGWGKDLIKLYNDPYKEIVRGKHPGALGSPASVVWKDIWRDIEPMLRQVMDKDQGTYVEAQLLIMERNGYPEETYYTFSYTPIPGDDGGTAGMICANTDDTDRIISERQLRSLTRLGKALTGSKTHDDVISRTIETLKENPYDFPFALFRTIADNKAKLALSTDLVDTGGVVKPEIDLTGDDDIATTICRAIATRELQAFDNLTKRVGLLPKGAWGVPPDKVIVLPISLPSSKEPYGILVIGVNPYRLLDEKYRGFFSLIADQVATSFSNVHALEQERKRSEALAEVDRAKTTFFSNISHEFRTPLTLLLSPVEDVMNDPRIGAENKMRMEVAYRNALRMQKLVNTLLEFSRIEAGRAEGRFQRVDIFTLTQDLASTFRSAIERAGMKLSISCTDAITDAYVDLEMWERIIMNLVSNAFKYSIKGEIGVAIRQSEGMVHVAVSDTGRGIPADQLERIFERFHRVDNAQGRSQEGTGIGLAMVKELVKIHNGTVRVESEPGKGSVFTVSIPLGKEHIAPEKIVKEETAPSFKHSAAFVHEALKWLPTSPEITGTWEQPSHNGKRASVLLADDNADMRDYLNRLLSEQFHVVTASDGEEAFAKALEMRPQLVLSDIMMPRLDGFGLLKKMRSHPDIKSTPVIFLSARAGEEAKVEGLDAGADDYLVKPFSARELIARVGNHIRINQVRKETENRFLQLFLEAPALINIFKGPDHVFELFHPRNKEFFGDVDYTGKPLFEVLPGLAQQGIKQLLDDVYQNGTTIQQREVLLSLPGPSGVRQHYFNYIFQPWHDMKGNTQGVLTFATDVSDQVRTRLKVEESEKQYRDLSEGLEVIVDKRTAELRRSNDDLQQFAHVASHDLKEPVRKLKTFINRLSDEFGDRIPAKGREYIDKMRNASARMYTMIEGVLKYSSFSEVVQEIEEVDLNDVMQSIETDLEVVIFMKKAVIEKGTLPVIQGAQVLLYQLFYNLVNNSLKFAKDKPMIRISARIIKLDGVDHAEISVSDNGIGFRQDYAGQIFHAFARLHSKDHYEGTGLGLALCKKIVERHYGTITAIGEENKGSTFIVSLPLIQREPRI
jgi:signal transduction histidine kinase